MPSNPKTYYGITVTVGTSSATLLSLLQAIESDVPSSCRALRLISAKDNVAQIISVGDEDVASAAGGRKSYALALGEFREYRTEQNTVYLGNIHVIADVAASLNVEVMVH